MNARIAMVLLLTLAACNAAPTVSSAPPSPEPWTITLEINSWGKLISRWQVNSDGSGEVWRVPQGVMFRAHDISKYRMSMDAAAMARFVQASAALRAATRKPIKCELVMTDMAYGSFGWSGAAGTQSFSFNYGCRSRKIEAAYRLMGDASEAVNRLAVIEPQPYATEHVGTR